MSYVGSVGTAANATSYPVVLPTVATNDVAYVFVAHTNTIAVASLSKTAAASGTVTEGGLIVDYYAIVLASSDSGTTFTVSMTSTASKTAVGIIIIRGVDTSDPMPIGTTIVAHDQSTTRTSPAVTVAETTDVISFIAERTASGTTTSFTAPAGVTKVQDQVNTSTAPNNLAVGYVTGGVTAGTYGPYAWTVNGGVTSARRVGIAIGVNASGGSPPTPTAGFLDATSTLVPIVSMKYLNASGTLVDLPSWSVH